MYVSLTGFTHDNDNRAVVERFTVEPVRDQRNIWRTTKKRMYLRGVVKGSTQALIRAELDAVKEAYGGDNFDIALYEDDGTRSHYYLTSNDSLGGVRVVVRDYPELGNDPSQYCTGVDYRIVVEADYAANELSPMIFLEEIDFHGDCGPEYGYHLPAVGPPVRYIERQSTLQVITQRGFALGLTGFPLIPNPLLPNLEDRPQRDVTEIGPEAAGANLRMIHFGMRWNYTFLSATPQIVFPNMR